MPTRNEYITYVQLPSEGGQLRTAPDGQPIDNIPWHPIPTSRIRTASPHPTGQVRSREIARDLYPLYPLRTDQIAAIESAPPFPGPEPAPACRYPNFIWASFEGMVEDDGTDQTDRLVAAAQKAIAEDKPLILDLHRIRSSKEFRLENLPPFSNLRIYSFIGTQIIISAGTSGDPWGRISGMEITGRFPVNFNSGGGDVPQNSFPFTKLAQSDGPGWTAKLVDRTPIHPGYFIKIQTKRLHNGEHRFSSYLGELNRVRALTSDGGIELDAKLRHNYRPGVLHSTTIAAISKVAEGADGAGTEYGKVNIRLSAGPPDELPHLQGLLMTVGGVERNVQWWDDDNLTVSFPYGHNNDQLPYSPQPTIGSTITFSADPWVFIYSPIHVTLWGVTIDATADLGGTQRGLHLEHVDQLVLQDFKTINTQIWGVLVENSFQPTIRYSSAERTNQNTLGYTTIFSAARDGLIDGYRSMNHRRMTDTGGQCQSVGMHIVNFQITGGWKTDTGVVWEDGEEINYGIGDHGQALDWIWENGIVRHAVTGALLRGCGETLRNIKFEGFFQSVIVFGAGEGRTLSNITVDDGLYAGEFLDSFDGIHYQSNNSPVFLKANMFDQSSSGYGYKGSADINNITINGTCNQFIYFEVGDEHSIQVRDWSIDGVVFRTQRNGPNAFLFRTGLSDDVNLPDGSSEPRLFLRNMTVMNIAGYYRGNPGGILAECGGLIFMYPNTWMRVGGQKYRFRLHDDAVMEIPFLASKSSVWPGNLVRIVTYPSAPDFANWQADLLMDVQTDAIVAPMGTVNNVTIQPVATIGVSDPAGSLNFGRDEAGAVGFKVRNRLGGEIWGVVEFDV